MMILNLLDDLLLQLANEERTEAEELTNIGLLITLYMTGTYLPLPVLSWLRYATVIDRYKGLLRSWPSQLPCFYGFGILEIFALPTYRSASSYQSQTSSCQQELWRQWPTHMLSNAHSVLIRLALFCERNPVVDKVIISS